MKPLLLRLRPFSFFSAISSRFIRLNNQPGPSWDLPGYMKPQRSPLLMHYQVSAHSVNSAHRLVHNIYPPIRQSFSFPHRMPKGFLWYTIWTKAKSHTHTVYSKLFCLRELLNPLLSGLCRHHECKSTIDWRARFPNSFVHIVRST